jgi:hypothetical protein
VRPALDRDHAHVVDQVLEPRGGRREGEDAVLRAVDDERGHVDLRDVGPEVRQPAVDTCVGREWRRADGDVEGRLPGAGADPAAAEHVDVVEVVEEVLEVRVPVLRDRGLDVLEDLAVDPFEVVLGLQQEGRYGAEQCGLPHPPRAVRAEIAGDLARSHREAD